MPFVFKYCDAHGVEILKNLEIKVTPPNQFNDPFEFTAYATCSDPEGWAKCLLKKDQIRKRYGEDIMNGRFDGTFRQYQEQFRKPRRELIETLVSNMPRVLEEAQVAAIDDASTRYGVLCLSSRPDSILMWGHYSDSHQGMVVGFDRSHKIFKGQFGLRDVNYERKRVVYDRAWSERSQEYAEFTEKIIFTKNEEWRYENEARQIFRLETLKQRLLPKKGIGYFRSIPPEAVVSVYLGEKCSPRLKADVLTALSVPHLAHVKSACAVLHRSEFRIDFE